jgi:hypothetical protein
MQLFLSQIKDIDNIPAYLKKLGELSLEDNNIVFNYRSDEETNDTYLGSGITIHHGDGVDKDVTFKTIDLGELYISGGYTASTGYENLAFSTELEEIVIRNRYSDGVRLVAESDVIRGGTF